MKITGYRIKERLNALLIDHKIASDSFNGSLVYFEDDGQGASSPDSVADRFAEAERRIAALQAVQARYNLSVTVEVQGHKMTLCEAVKRVGGAGRIEKMWRDATSTLRGVDWRGTPTLKRSRDDVVAKRALSPEDCGKRAVRAARYAAALRAAVAQGNTVEIDLDCDPSLFEDAGS